MSELDPRVAELIAAVESTPADEESWDELEDLAAKLQRPDEIGAAYRKVLAPGLAPELVERVGQRALGFHEEWFGEASPHLVDVLERILKLDAGLSWALQRITVVLTVKEGWTDLLAHFDRAIEAAGDDTFRRTSLLEEAAQLAKDFAGQPGRAVGYLSQLLDLRPHDAQLFTSLERLLERENKHAELVALWRRKLEDETGAADVRARIADTYLDKLSDPAAALAEAQLLAEAGDARASAITERVLVHASASLEVRREALAALKEAYERAGRGADVERVLALALDRETREGAIELHRELAERMAARGDAAGAFSHVAKLLLLDPGDSVATDKLAELAQSSGDHAAHAEALEAAAEGATGSRRVSLLLDAADVRASSGDAAGGEAAYRRVLAMSEAGQSVRLEVARKLSALLDRPERREDRLAALEAQAAIERDPSEKRRVLGLVAQLATELAAYDRALGAWAERLTADAADVDALDARIAIFRQTQRWDELVDALQARLACTTSPAVRRGLLLDVAQVLEQQIGDRGEAITAYLAAATELGEEPGIVDALSRLYGATGKGAELEALLGRASQNDAGRAVDMLVRLADAKRANGGAAADAARELLRALRLDPANAPARAGLMALLEDASMRGLAAEGLADAAMVTRDHAELLRLLPVRLAAAESTRVKVKLLREAAELQEKELSDTSGAFDSIASALALAPSEESLERELLRLAAATSRSGEAGVALSRAAAAVEEPGRSAELFRTACRVRAEAGDAAGALSDAMAAVRLVPRDRETVLGALGLSGRVSGGDAAAAAEAWVSHAFAMRAIDAGVTEVLESNGEAIGWDALTTALEAATALAVKKALEGAGAPHLRSIGLAELGRDLENRVAAYHRDRRGDETKSMAALSRALEHDAGHADTLRELARLQWRAPGRPLVDTLLALSERLVGDLDALYDAARIAVDPVGDLVLAREVLERLFREATRLWRRGERARGEHPAERTAMDAHKQIVELEITASRYERAIEWLVEGSRLPIPANESRAMLRRAADIAREKLNDETRALRLYQQVIDDSLEDGDAVDRVATIYEARARVPELLALRRRELELPLAPERKLQVRLEVARLLGVLEDKGGRLDVLRANLSELPGHEASIQELSSVLESKGKNAELHELLSSQAKRLEEGEPARAARLWGLAAKVAEERLSDQERALAAHRRVVTLAPSPAAYEALARLHLARGEAGQAAEWLERLLETTTGSARVALHVKLAEARLAAGKSDRATLALERALAEAPDAAEVRERLATLYREQKAFEPLAKLLADGAMRAGASDPERTVAYAKEAALLYRDEVGHVDRAIPVLEHALTIGTLDQETRACLADAYRAAGRLPDAKQILEGIVADFGRRRSPERALVHYQLAQVARDANDFKDALDQLDKASSMDMGHAGILRMQGQLAREAGQLDRSERAFRALLLVVRRQPVDAEGLEVGASEVLYELSRLARDRGHASQADELLESARETAKQHLAEAARFTRVLLARNDVALAEEVITARLAQEAAGPGRARALFDQATLLDKGKNEPKAALAARLAALEILPESPRELDATRELAKRAGETTRFANALEQMADKLRRKEDALLGSDLLFRAGLAMEEDIEVGPARGSSPGADGEDGPRSQVMDALSLVRAAELYQRVEALGARSVDAWRALGRVARKRGDRVEEIRVLRRLVAAGVDTGGLEGDGDLDESQRTDALYRIAEVELRTDETLESGLDTLRDAVRRDSDHARAARIAAEAAKAMPEHEGLALFWERTARDAGDSGLLLSYLRHRIAKSGGVGGSASLEEVQEGVTIATALGEDDAIEPMLLKGAEIAETALGGLAGALWIPTTLAERRSAAGDVRGAITWTQKAADAAEAAGDADRALELLREVAQLAKGIDPKLAASAFSKIVEKTPSDRTLWAPLAEVYATLRDREGYEIAVRLALDGLSDRADRNDLRVALADQLIGTYGSEADGVAVLKEALDEDPDSLPASERLLDIFQKNGENEQLAELLERQLDRARDRGDVEAITSLSLRRGGLLEGTRREDAMDVYRSALDWAPEDVRVLGALFRLYGPDDDQLDRAALGERLLAVSEAAQAAPLAAQLADAYQAAEDEDAVGRVLDVGFRRAPQDATLLTRLTAWLEAREDRDGLAEIVAYDAAHRADAGQRKARFREAAGLFVAVGRPERAAEILGDAVTASPDDLGLFAEYATALEASGRSEDGIALATQSLEGRTGAERGQLLALRARLALTAGQSHVAVNDLEEAFQLSPREHLVALIAALEAHREAVENAGDRDEERRVTLRLVAVLTSAGNAARAREVLAHWTSRDPDDVVALRTLRDIDVMAQRPLDALWAASRLVEIETEDAQVDAALRLNEIAQQAGDPGAARAGLERVFADQPAQKSIRDALRAMYESTESWAELAGLLLADAQAETGDARFDILKRVGEILVHRVGDCASAVEPIREALALHPEDGDTIVLLSDAYMGADALAEAVELLNEAINQKGRKRSPALAGMQLRMARIAGLSGDAATQMEWLKVALDTDKGNNVIAAELAELAIAVGDDATAMNALKVVTLQKTPGPMSKALAFLRQAQIAARQGDHQKAVLWARRARIEDPELTEAEQFLQSLGEG
jgi:lipopolysaccharide biosynthesis regulator YciM